MWQYFAVGVLWIVWGAAAEFATTYSAKATEIIQVIASVLVIVGTFLIARF